jgi:hypothetical protein
MECNVAVLGAWDPKHCIVHGPFAQGAPLKGTTERQVPLRGEHGRESYRCQGTSDRLASCLATLSVAKPVGRCRGALRGSRADPTSTPMGSDPASSHKVPLVHEAVLCHGRSWRGGRLGVAVKVRGLSQPDLPTCKRCSTHDSLEKSCVRVWPEATVPPAVATVGVDLG